MLQPGDLIDIWVVERALGAGGMGSVYRCHNKSATRILAAIKVLESGLRRSGDAEARFVREAEILFHLDHPNIVKVRNVRIDADPPYIEMEFVQGESLEGWLRKGALPLDQALDVIAQLCTAVAYLHHNGIRHRDIKPANVLIKSDGQVKLVDFGLAVETATTRITQAGMTFGTVSYAPPEWIRPDSLDPRLWDVYALGVVLWEMLTGKVAFPVTGEGSARQQAMAVIVSKQDHPPLDPGEAFHEDLRLLVGEMTHPRADRRPQSMADVLARLEELDPTLARRTGTTLVAEDFAVERGPPETWMLEEVEKATGGQPDTREHHPPRGMPTPKLPPSRDEDPRPGGHEPTTVELEVPPQHPGRRGRLALGLAGGALALVALVAVCAGIGVVGMGLGDDPVEPPLDPTVGEVLADLDPAPLDPVEEPAPDVQHEVYVEPDPPEPDPTPAPEPPPPGDDGVVAVEPPPESPPEPPPEPPPEVEPPAVVSHAGPVTRGQFAAWLADHPSWQPQEAVAAGKADVNYLVDWADGRPPPGTEGQFMVNVSWYAAASYCTGRGGLAPLEAAPHAWTEGVDAPPLEYRQSDGRAAYRGGDGTTFDRARGKDANGFTGFRCAR